MPDINLNEWEIAQRFFHNQPDGTKLPRSLMRNGSPRVKKNGSFFASNDYHTTHSFIKLHGKIYALKDVIGKGVNGRVKTLESEHDALEEVVKISTKGFNTNETSALINLGYSPGIIRRLESLKTYLPMKNLGKSLLEHIGGITSQYERLHIAIGSAIALLDLHNQGFAHLDFKLDNLTVDAGGNIYLIDFGTIEKNPTSLVQRIPGSPLFTPVNTKKLRKMDCDSVAFLRSCFLPESFYYCAGRFITTKTNAIYRNHSLFTQEMLDVFQLTDIFDTGEHKCNSPQSFSRISRPLYVLAAILIAAKNHLPVPVDKLDNNPLLCHLLISLHKREKSSEEMLFVLEKQDEYMAEELNASHDDSNADTLSVRFFCHERGIRLYDGWESDARLLDKLIKTNAFYPHIQTLFANPSLIGAIKDELVSVDVLVTLLNNIPQDQAGYLMRRLMQFNENPLLIDDLSSELEAALAIIDKKGLMLSYRDLKDNPVLVPLLNRLDYLRSSSFYDYFMKMPKIVEMLIADDAHEFVFRDLASALLSGGQNPSTDTIRIMNSWPEEYYMHRILKLRVPLQLLTNSAFRTILKHSYGHGINNNCLREMLTEIVSKHNLDLFAVVLAYFDSLNPAMIAVWLPKMVSKTPLEHAKYYQSAAQILFTSRADTALCNEVLRCFHKAHGTTMMRAQLRLLSQGLLDEKQTNWLLANPDIAQAIATIPRVTFPATIDFLLENLDNDSLGIQSLNRASVILESLPFGVIGDETLISVPLVLRLHELGGMRFYQHIVSSVELRERILGSAPHSPFTKRLQEIINLPNPSEQSRIFAFLAHHSYCYDRLHQLELTHLIQDNSVERDALVKLVSYCNPKYLGREGSARAITLLTKDGRAGEHVKLLNFLAAKIGAQFIMWMQKLGSNNNEIYLEAIDTLAKQDATAASFAKAFNSISQTEHNQAVTVQSTCSSLPTSSGMSAWI